MYISHCLATMVEKAFRSGANVDPRPWNEGLNDSGTLGTIHAVLIVPRYVTISRVGFTYSLSLASSQAREAVPVGIDKPHSSSASVDAGSGTGAPAY
jgi:hypothetical protein